MHIRISIALVLYMCVNSLQAYTSSLCHLWIYCIFDPEEDPCRNLIHVIHVRYDRIQQKRYYSAMLAAIAFACFVAVNAVFAHLTKPERSMCGICTVVLDMCFNR